MVLFGLTGRVEMCWLFVHILGHLAFLVAQLAKNPPAMPETWVRSLGWEDPLEKGKATHSSILPWRIPWTVYSMGSPRAGHNWATFTSFHFGQLKKYLSIERNKSEVKKKNSKGPLVQWLELQASTTGGVDLIPSQETKIPYAMQLGQKKKKEEEMIACLCDSHILWAFPLSSSFQCCTKLCVCV